MMHIPSWAMYLDSKTWFLAELLPQPTNGRVQCAARPLVWLGQIPELVIGKCSPQTSVSGGSLLHKSFSGSS